ncbi:MAG TPA: PIN domain-containing protein [Alphaproteobacteria bacterium]|nr:PIN domain-containing protein [Alphaproteobacteria bacterium]
MQRVILDTNVFVAAGFNLKSASAKLLEEIEAGRLALIWNQATRRETQSVLDRIPPLGWRDVHCLFNPEFQHGDEGRLSAVSFVEDPADRKFAALAVASGAPLVTMDEDLLTHRDRLDVLTPGEFLEHRL